MLLAVLAHIGWFFTSPIHELGHVIFGFLSFNPTRIIGWGLSRPDHEGFIMAVGGYLLEIAAAGVLGEIFNRKAKKAWFISMLVLVYAFWSLAWQTDVLESDWGKIGLVAAQVLWYGFALTTGIFMVYRRCRCQIRTDPQPCRKPACGNPTSPPGSRIHSIRQAGERSARLASDRMSPERRNVPGLNKRPLNTSPWSMQAESLRRTGNFLPGTYPKSSTSQPKKDGSPRTAYRRPGESIIEQMEREA